mmetsp:Transcript_66255/g.117657  ORF Transcript_66255/g.117657 Transcript_66255/m.117657 type:complete len:83 (+) Transcript_66255:264-512(+)
MGWEALPPLSTLKWCTTICVLDSRLFVIGGATVCGEEYVTLESRWFSVRDMPKGVAFAVSVAWYGKVLVIGSKGTSIFEIVN